jgi:hypothetical protein
MRRVPTNATELLTDPGDASKQNENYAADADGLKRLIAIAEKELSKADRAKVDVEQRAGLKDSAAFNALPEKDRLARRANAINKVRPDLALGDPHLIDTGPRPATPDAANIALLVNQANTVFITIASGAADKDIENVFGATKVGDAKGKYAKAQAAMNKIFAAGKILTDRSGYNDEVNVGGLTTFNEVILSHLTGAISPYLKARSVMWHAARTVRSAAQRARVPPSPSRWVIRTGPPATRARIPSPQLAQHDRRAAVSRERRDSVCPTA